MGWWPFSSESRGDAIRSGTAIPTRNERAICWAARDAYFACLDANNIIDATKEPGATDAARACPQQSADFERDCAAAWVKYFKQWRVADIKKRKTLDELKQQQATPMEVTSEFGAGNSDGNKGKSKQELQDMLEQKKRG